MTTGRIVGTGIEENRVELSPSGQRFSTFPAESLLESGLGAGIALPFSCANGSCGDCRARVVSGQVTKIRFHDYALTESEKLAGVCLLCSNAAQSDLIIDVNEALTVADIPAQALRARLCHREILADISIVRFKLSRGKAFRYLPGQYATIRWQDGSSVSLPVANCPCEPDFLEFHIPREATVNNQPVTSPLGKRERVMIEGPHGHFVLDTPPTDAEYEQCNKCFIAIGEGFAAVKPLLELVMSLDREIPCCFIWIASCSVSRYRHNLVRSWSDAFDNVSYLPLDNTDEFNTDLVQRTVTSPVQTDFYLSGNLCQCEKICDVLATAGVQAQNISVDRTCINQIDQAE